MNNSINFNYAVNNLAFMGAKRTLPEMTKKAIEKHAVTTAITGASVTAAMALSQLVKKDTNSTNANSNLAKVPDSVEEMKARLTYNTPANLDELKGHIKYMENFIKRAAEDVKTTKYVEFTGVNTPDSKFTVYEPNEDGKYQITRQSKDPDYKITNIGGKYDFYYDKNGKVIGETVYNPKTNARIRTWVHNNGVSVRKDFNPDGTVKGYLLNQHNGTVLEYNANGEVIYIGEDELHVKNSYETLKYLRIDRADDEFSYLHNESKWYTDENGNTVVEFKKDKYMYKGRVDYVDGLVDVVKTGKATPPKTEMSPEKAKILAKAGFTEEVIGDLKLESEFYGPKLIDEVLDMVVYLEGEIAKGTPITKNLIEKTITKFSPGASGGSSACQRSILAQEWNKGAKVRKAYS